MQAFLQGIAQKRLINDTTYASWPQIGSQAISNDGKFISFAVGTRQKSPVFTVQSVDGSWKKELYEILNGRFTTDSRRFVYLCSGDSVGILELGTGNRKYIQGVADFSLVEGVDQEEIVFRKRDKNKSLFLEELARGRIQEFPDISDYRFSANGRTMLSIVAGSVDSSSKGDLYWLNRNTGIRRKLCHACGAKQLTADESGSEVVFISEQTSSGIKQRTIRYFRDGMDSALIIAGPSTKSIEGLNITDYLSYDVQCNRIYLKLEKLDEKIADSSVGAQVQAYSLLTREHLKWKHDRIYAATVNLYTLDLHAPEQGIIRLQRDEDDGDQLSRGPTGNWVVTPKQ